MRLDIERQKKLKPKRIRKAISEINKLGYKIDYITGDSIVFKFKNQRVTFYPYSGWHSGKSIKDGRGLNKLLKQIMGVG